MTENIFQEVEMFLIKEGTLFAKAFKSGLAKADQIAVAITEDVQTALKNGSADELAKIIEGVFPSVKNLPDELLAGIKTFLPKVLAVELGLQAELTGITPDNSQALATAICNAFNVSANNSKVWSTLAGQVTQILQADTTKTWASYIADVEAAFVDLKADIDAQA
jgi:hypothetical protein